MILASFFFAEMPLEYEKNATLSVGKFTRHRIITRVVNKRVNVWIIFKSTQMIKKGKFYVKMDREE